MSSFATIVLLMGLVRSSQTLDGKQLLFTVIGETTRESGYAHLVVPLPVPTLGNTVDMLHDLISSFGEFTMKPNNLYRRQRVMGLTGSKPRLGSSCPWPVREGLWRRNSTMMISTSSWTGSGILNPEGDDRLLPLWGPCLGWPHLAAPSSTPPSWTGFNEDRQQIEENQQFLMDELLEQNLRINNITRFVEEQYKAWVKQVKLIQESQRRTVMVEMGQQIHLLIQAFRIELTDFLTGITRLMDHRLSPLLVQPKALEDAFGKLKNAARLQNMRPMSEDAEILF